MGWLSTKPGMNDFGWLTVNKTRKELSDLNQNLEMGRNHKDLSGFQKNCEPIRKEFLSF
jgi:hypothetical protein